MLGWSYVIAVVSGYLIGSIPWALIIGKKYYDKDIRNYGSHNLGGTNAGRVLGAKAGAVVILLDITKVVLVFLLNYLLMTQVFGLTEYTIQLYLAGIMAEIGHCYPFCAQFRGGKAVSAYTGFMLSTNWLITIIMFLIYGIVLKKTKMVSLSALISSACGMILGFIPIFQFGMCYHMQQNWMLGAAIGCGTILLWFRHRQNIQRIMTKTERKISWLK